jgi:hypothetical protein
VPDAQERDAQVGAVVPIPPPRHTVRDGDDREECQRRGAALAAQ